MMKWLFIFFLSTGAFGQHFSPQEVKAWKQQASHVTIYRDSWGIAHVFGKTDADAVFGLLYAQCEENFEKVEENNLEMLGRLSEIGKVGLYDDLMMKIIYDTI